MPVKWDPKVTGPLRPSLVEEGRRHGPEGAGKSGAALTEPPLPEHATAPEAPRPTPSQAAAERTALDKRADETRAMLRAAADKRTAGRAALAFCTGYAMRRSRGARRRAVELCDDVASEAPELAGLAGELRLVLTAEGALHETTGEATLRACRTLVRLLEREREGGESQVEAIARATLAHGLIQLAVQFPAELVLLELGPGAALREAMLLAEEAIALAPDLPDGHTALGRALLCHDDPAAQGDAVAALERALAADAEHDPAEVDLAAAHYARGDDGSALAALDRALRRGNPMPQTLLLRGLIHLRAGRAAEARRDIERAVQIAPEAGMLRLDAARAAEAEGDRTAAAEHRAAARQLLGSAFDALARAHDSGDA